MSQSFYSCVAYSRGTSFHFPLYMQKKHSFVLISYSSLRLEKQTNYIVFIDTEPAQLLKYARKQTSDAIVINHADNAILLFG